MPGADARERVLAAIRRRMPTGDPQGRAEAVAQRLATPRVNLIPRRGQGDEAHRLRVFREMMEAVGGSVELVEQAEEVPEAAAAYLRRRNLPARLRRGSDPFIAHLPWHRAGTIEIVEGRAEDGDQAAISRAFAGAAESGTVILLSGPENPTTLNFLPEAHIVVLKLGDLHASYEEAWIRLRELLGPGQMPRTVNMISGPSRTADIEQTIVRPAHGPKDMHVILVR
jgi:L-lactate dehydrogenase complex protein LldG